MLASLIERDLKHIWHPCSQMKDYDVFKPIEIIGASGSYLELKQGRKVIDAISSWWCKSLGHNHPRLKQAVVQQLDKFEHVILANTTNDTIVALSEKLAGLTKTLDKVFYASEGSSAVEIALKISLHARMNAHEHHKNLFFSLQNSYHGETIGALSVSDLGLYSAPYKPLLFDVQFLKHVPYVNDTNDPLWFNCESDWKIIEAQLGPYSARLTAIIVEPIVQGAGGMKIYSQDFLRRLSRYCQEREIHLIADEIMTGIGRTGKMLACEYAEIEPDFLCLAKGLTSGFLPLSVVLTKNDIYQLFYDDYVKGKSFLHSHTQGGNALAAACALEVLNIFDEENILARVNAHGERMRKYMQEIALRTEKLTNVRSIGAIAAADLICDPVERMGYQVFRKAMELGALLRPLGNTIYWLPPLNVSVETLTELKDITEQSIFATLTR